MKFHSYVWFALLLGASVLTGCASKPDFERPQGYTHDTREAPFVNLYFPPCLSAGVDASMQAELRERVDGYFRETKRFVIFWREAGDLKNGNILIHTFVDFVRTKTTDLVGEGVRVRLVGKYNLADGRAGDAIDVAGVSAPVVDENRLSGRISFSRKAMFIDALNKALKNLRTKIERKFPISSRVSGFHCQNGEKTEFLLPIGTNWGLTRYNDFVIYYRYPDGRCVNLALGRCIPGLESSQVLVTAWNLADSEVRDVFYPRIMKNDKTLTDSLFVVAKYQDK